MKTNMLLFAALLTAAVYSCNKSSYTTNATPPPTLQVNYKQTVLVADTLGYGAAFIDSNLRNAWGIALNPMGIVWISANHAGATTIYDSTGKTLFGPVAIPSQGSHFGGSPTGIAFNSTTDFIIPSNRKVAKFIFANEDGTISAWGGGDSTTTVVDRSATGAVYKGITIANDGTSNFLFAANFKGTKIDVFDASFNPVTTKSFNDPQIPAGFGPFNIASIAGKLFVCYAKLKGPDNMDDQAGPGNGYVDVFDTNGKLLQRFISQNQLNSPWGIAQAPAGFGIPFHSIAVGNFGDGKINVYDSTGVYLGQLQNNGNAIVIPGLWALDFPKNEVSNASPNKLYFTAGPMDENHGLFGFIEMN